MATKIDKIHAELGKLLPELELQKAEVLDSLKAEYAERDALIAKIQPLEAELYAVQQRIKKGEKPLREIGLSIAEVHRVKGARSLRNG